MLSKSIIDNLLDHALTSGGSFAEVFIEDKIKSRISFTQGYVRDSLSGRDYGVGIRIFDGINSIYGYTNNSSVKSLESLVKELSTSLGKQRKAKPIALNECLTSNNSIISMPFSKVSKKQKVDMLKTTYEAAINYDKYISSVTLDYKEEEQNVLIANSEGLHASDRRTRTRLSISSIASGRNEIQQGFYAPGASMGFEFYDIIDPEEVGIEASRIARAMLFAKPTPGGRMPVVVGNGFGGVLFHEACGHSLEASFVSKGISAFGDKLGEVVASPILTAVDNGTLENAWGTTFIDDEGIPTRKNILIEDGVLRSYLVDRLNGERMGSKPTGSSRRQSYRYPPTSRMNNTFIEPGDSTLGEMISSIGYGLYAKKLAGGSVNPASGDFNFSVMEGYLIENGRISAPVKGATLVGNGIEILKAIDMVGDNFELGQGTCGASSGSIPVSVGQPALRISEITVGGKG